MATHPRTSLLLPSASTSITDSSNTVGGSVKITTKGQVTIPQSIREQLGLLPHTEVEFEVRGDEVVLTRADSRRRGRRVVDRLRGRGDVPRTTDEIMALTRGE